MTSLSSHPVYPENAQQILTWVFQDLTTWKILFHLQICTQSNVNTLAFQDSGTLLWLIHIILQYLRL